MVQTGRLAQMADGIHVLGDTINQLATNYIEVLTRAEDCGLTFKPSKVIICPRVITLFGWELRDHVWHPTSHTISALVNATQPTTVKKLRSFLGSFKQLSASLPNYAATVHDLEQVVGGKASGERIIWNDTLQAAFSAAKQLAADPQGIAEPRPEDHLSTYSDYSAESRAVGGRLVISRTNADGSTQQLIEGFFSAVLDRHKQHWLPCEGEAAAIRLVLNHFQNQIRESNHPTIHYTDSQPCVLAWQRSRRGAFSSSSRINAFLTGLSVLPVEVRYKPGKEMLTSDFASRNPFPCKDTRCQICRFAQEWQEIGDNALYIRSLTVEDIKAGKSIMPMIQTSVWKNIQMNDSVHSKLLHLINTRQLPETRKTRGDYTKLKLLHNLYTQGKLFIQDGLFLVKTPDGHFNEAAISVPPSLFPGIANAIHIRLDHPSKGQLANLISRYFYTPGWRNIIDQLTDACHQCIALRKLPKVLIEDTHSQPQTIASRFAADVIERESQKILIVREHISQFTRGAIIQDQTAQSLQQALISLIVDIIPDSGTEVRVDGATAFQALERESIRPGTMLNKLKIKIVVGRLLNKNKNPNAENAVQEVLKELLRLKQHAGPISTTDLDIALKNINARIRCHSLTPKEVLFRRNVVSNDPIDVPDHQITRHQEKQKQTSSQASYKNKLKTKQPTALQSFNVGDLVMLRDAKSKNKPRETFIVEHLPNVDTPYILIRKLSNSLRSRLYKALPDELIRANLKPLNCRPTRKAAEDAKVKIKQSVNVIKAKHQFRHGWNEEDQNFEEDLYTHALGPDTSSESSSITSTCSTPSTHPPADPPNDSQSTSTPSDTSSQSDEEPFWDTSPAQFTLSDNPAPMPLDAWSSTPFITTTMSKIPPAFPRDRNYAFSQPPLVRRNAFRLPNNNDAFSNTPPPPQPSRSRIPKPVSPTRVRLHGVSDLSSVLPSDPYQSSTRRSTCVTSIPVFLGIEEVDTQEARNPEGRNKGVPRKQR